jgi:hypothetical protein
MDNFPDVPDPNPIVDRSWDIRAYLKLDPSDSVGDMMKGAGHIFEGFSAVVGL